MATSQNGYAVLFDNRTTGPAPRLRKWVVPGTGRHFYVRDGSAGFNLIYAALWWHEHLEPIGEGVWDEWGWAVRPIRGQTSGYSNHASGTAIDVNATRHPIGVSISSTFTAAKVAALRLHLRDTYRTQTGNPVIRWGGEWDRPDGMHVESCAGIGDQEQVAARLMFTEAGQRILAANPGAEAVIADDNPWVAKFKPEPAKPAELGPNRVVKARRLIAEALRLLAKAPAKRKAVKNARAEIRDAADKLPER